VTGEAALRLLPVAITSGDRERAMPTSMGSERPWFISPAALGAAQNGAPAVNVARMRSDLEYLCSKELGGRLSLSPGAELAAEYIGREFEKAGLAPAVPAAAFCRSSRWLRPWEPRMRVWR